MFSDLEKKAFKKDGVFEIYKLHGEYKFFWTLGEHHKELGLKVWEMDDGRFYVTQSHHVHGPFQVGPYHSSRVIYNSAEEALMSGLDNITAYGKSEVEAGHEFDDAWFIPNKRY